MSGEERMTEPDAPPGVRTPSHPQPQLRYSLLLLLCDLWSEQASPDAVLSSDDFGSSV